MSEFHLQPALPIWLIAIVAMVLLGLLFVGPTKKLPRGKLLTLIILRVLAVLILLLTFVRPALVHKTLKKTTATVAFLFDASRSMSVTDVAGNKERWEVLKEQFEQYTPQLNELAEEVDVKVFTFADELIEVEPVNGVWSLPDKAEGTQTAIGASMRDVLRNLSDQQLLSMVLFSDGVQRTIGDLNVSPMVPAGQLAASGVPIYTLAYGQSRGFSDTSDLAVTGLSVNPTVFAKNDLNVSGSIRVDGFVNKQVVVELEFETESGKMEVVDSQIINVRAGGQQYLVDLNYVPTVPGERKVVLKVAEQEGELITNNNELATFVTVLKGGVNALYIEGRPRTEAKFILESVGASPNLHIDYFTIPYNPNVATSFPEEEKDWFEPGRYDVYIIGDVHAKTFKQSHLEKLSKLVSEGAGLMTLGGDYTYGPGGYIDTPLKDVLPVMMNRLERQDFGRPINQKFHHSGTQKMKPTQQGLRQFIMAIDNADNNEAAWEELPGLFKANKIALDTTRIAARVLAVNQDEQPLLIAQDRGLGRVLSFAGDSTWRWVLHGHQREHRRFWRQSILWMAHKEQAQEGDVWTKLDRRRYSPGDRVELIAGAQTPNGEPITDATFEAVISMPDNSTETVTLSRQGDEYRGIFFNSEQPGDYVIKVNAKQKGFELGTSSARFIVHKEDLELDNPAPDIGLLMAMAKQTNGKLILPEQLPDLFEELKERTQELEVEILKKSDLYDNWYVLILFVVILGTEWFLRKLWAMV